MARLRDEVSMYKDDFADCISWMLVWKSGRSWNIEKLWDTEYEEGWSYPHRDSRWNVSAEDARKIRAAMAEDPKAMVLCGYYDNIGDTEHMTVKSLEAGIRWQYEHSQGLSALLIAAMDQAETEAAAAGTVPERAEETETEDAPMMARAMAKADREESAVAKMLRLWDEASRANEAGIRAQGPGYQCLDPDDWEEDDFVAKPFSVPRFALPEMAPIGSLCDEIDQILAS